MAKAASNFGYQELYNNADSRQKFTDQVIADLPDLVRQAAGDDYFQQFTVSLGCLRCRTHR